MKVAAAAVGIFCCLIIVTVVNGAVYRVQADVTYVDGQKVVTCSTESGGQRYTLNDGESKRLPSVNGGYCVNCGPCSEGGMSCADQYSASPGCPGLQYHTDANGNIWAVGK